MIAVVFGIATLVFCEGLSLDRPASRRVFLELSPALIASPAVSFAALPPASRDVDVGGGYDLLSERRGAAERDAIYPKSMEGRWSCERIVAREKETNLGGKSNQLQEGKTEVFETRYIFSPLVEDAGVVADRGYEISSRAKTNEVQWNVATPNALEFDNKVKLIVVKRSVEPPSDKGFGFDELLRVEDGTTTRAVQVKRRYRRSFDEQGNRIVEGLEITKTFRVLDGIAGIEFPTSTVKSQLRLVRPPL
eukprot:CAMPEP_0172361906 /NCGR_PEP_ID=MMETSP1060-20121228/5663_1 /TAXON_ID=37318 /ORGANISM="Pseudo-nitzschia pungens, Strain cf. cingulata" /LENGTH=248 /DNA_ID=CAMNT_0013084303 /DNA_START=17 /DNA_END=764 /DNA_ORIENTATION=-